MNNESLQVIFIVIVIVVLLALALSPVIGIWAFVILQNRKRRKIREGILSARRDVIGNKRWFPVRYASRPRFDSWFKIFPWEGAGFKWWS